MNTIISLGGSLVVPKDVNIGFLKRFRSIILNYKKKNKLGIIVGGGNICRVYQNAALKVKKTKTVDLDWIGIYATKLNAQLVRSVFGENAYSEIVYNPSEKVKTKKIIVAGGYLPGHSTDYDAVLLARNLGCKMVINLTNVDYVYNKNPFRYKNAKPFKTLSWNKYLRIIGRRWISGLHAPFDPIAAQLAKRLGIKVIIANGRNLDNLKHILNNEKFKGTIIG